MVRLRDVILVNEYEFRDQRVGLQQAVSVKIRNIAHNEVIRVERDRVTLLDKPPAVVVMTDSQVVEFAHVSHRILAGRRFQRHRAIGRNEAGRPIATAHLAIISCFRGGPSHREEHAAALNIVSRVDVASTSQVVPRLAVSSTSSRTAAFLRTWSSISRTKRPTNAGRDPSRVRITRASGHSFLRSPFLEQRQQAKGRVLDLAVAQNLPMFSEVCSQELHHMSHRHCCPVPTGIGIRCRAERDHPYGVTSRRIDPASRKKALRQVVCVIG